MQPNSSLSYRASDTWPEITANKDGCTNCIDSLSSGEVMSIEKLVVLSPMPLPGALRKTSFTSFRIEFATPSFVILR